MKTYLVLFSILLTCLSAQAQTQLENSEVVKVMQKLADTTIVIQYPSVWGRGPYLQFLSKKGDTINAYAYQRPTDRKINSKLPIAIAGAILSKDNSDYISEPVSLNRYFIIKDINPDTLKNVWKNMLKLGLWSTKDDAVEGSGCPISKHSNIIDDAGGIYILLISRAEINPLNFYAPEEFEKFCPGRKGRQTAIKLSCMMHKIFKE